jgi:hypothetical protein
MNKAGIITFHCSDNFGAVLQVYALQEVIKEMNIDVEIIDFRPKELTTPYNHSVDFIKYFKDKRFKSATKLFLANIYNYKNIKVRLKAFNLFRGNYLKLSTSKYYTSKDLLNNPPEYKYYITGSDQVWNPYFKKAIGDSYFLDFVNNQSMKISYAASIAQTVEQELVKDYKNYINQFDYISIREKSSLDFLKGICNKNINVSLDPTLLLNKEKWKVISQKPEIKEKYILVYDLQNNHELVRLANKISKDNNLKVISYSNKRKYNDAIQSFKYKGPREFLGLFENAELILTSSFHGTVFSIINEKPFYTIPHSTRGSRMIDLLKILNLEDRIVYKSDDVKKIENNINYGKVNSLLEYHRQESIHYLKKSFGK